MSNKVTRFYNYRLRGTDQQVGDQLIVPGALWSLPQTRNPDTGVVGAPYRVRGALAITQFGLQQRAAAADLTVGIGFRLRNDQWKAGQWDDSVTGAEYIEDTADAQDTGADDFALETTTVNDGFVVLSRVPFSWLSVNVSTAGIGAATVATVRYSNLAGTGWTTLGTNQTFDGSDNFTRAAAANLAAGENIFAWYPPLNWGRVTSLSNLPNDYYAWQVRCTTAPTTAALATALEIGTLVAVGNVDDDGTFGQEQAYHWEPFGDAIVAYFSTLNIGNSVQVEYRHAG